MQISLYIDSLTITAANIIIIVIHVVTETNVTVDALFATGWAERVIELS
jgi:hypothetical protein